MKSLNLPLIIAIVFIAIAGIGFYTAYKKEQDQVSIMVATKTLSPFLAVDANQLQPKPVSRSSVTSTDLTEADYHKLYTDYVAPGTTRKTPRQLIPSYTILPGQRIDTDALINPNQPQQSFSVVLPDERVVAATTSASGAALGVIQPGSIVDAQTAGSGSNQIVSQYDKVLCIAITTNGCRGVLGAGEQPSFGTVKSGGLSASGGGGPVNILLAVPAGDASEIAGQQVTLSLNTLCAIDQFGFFVSKQTAKQFACPAPAGRMASNNQLRIQREQKSLGTATSAVNALHPTNGATGTNPNGTGTSGLTPGSTTTTTPSTTNGGAGSQNGATTTTTTTG